MHRLRPRAACVLFALAIIATVPASALADDDATSEEIAEARERFAEGRRYEDAQQFDKALVMFESVARVKMTPQVRFHIALCLMHTGKLAEALSTFRIALQEAETKAPNVVVESKQHIASLEKRVARLTVQTTHEDPALSASIDGRDIQLRTAIDVDPGSHTIVLKREGIAVDKRELTLAAGERSTLEMSTSAAPMSSRRAASFVSFGVAGAAFVGAGVFGVLRADRLATVEAACPTLKGCDRSLEPVVREGVTYATTVNVLLGVGLAATAVGGVLLATSIEGSRPNKAVVSDVRIVPAVASGSGFVWATGRF